MTKQHHKPNFFKRHKVLTGLCVLFLLILIGSTSNHPKKQEASSQPTTHNTSTQKIPPAASQPAPKPSLSADPLTRIQQIPAKYYDKFEITVFSQSGDMANASNGPWEVVVNSPLYAFSLCSGAKNTVYNIMKDLYTDSVTRPNIYLVKISLSDQAQASLGRNDAYTLTADIWDNLSGPGIAKALYGTNSDTTYWLPINGHCAP